MKHYLVIFSILIFSYSVVGQTSFDVTINGTFSPSPIIVGGTSTLGMNFCNVTPAGTPVPSGGVDVNINFGSGYNGTSPPTGTWASFFNWTPLSTGWYGISNATLPLGCGTFNFPVTGINIGTTPSDWFARIIPPNNDSSPGNNTGGGGLTVNSPPLPLSLTAFKALNTNCGTINLEWETSSERNNDYMEVLRSIDGIEFLALGRVSGTNTDSRSSRTYSFVDNFDLKDSQKYYYRLKQVDFDGRSELFEIISAVNHCDKKISLSLFPNPAIDKVNLSLSGFNERTDVKFNILNQKGALLRTIQLNSGTSFELFLNDFPPGIYHLQSTEAGVSLSTKFIKIQ